MSWRLAHSLEVLRKEVDAAYPARPKSADGTIGDARHQAETSDHNPNAAGVVTAWDITTAPFTIALAEKLRLMGKAGDGRVKYVIYRGHIASAIDGWVWRVYSGASQHFDHIHLSVSAVPAQYDRTDPWRPFTVAAQTAVNPTPTPSSEDEVTPQDLEAIRNMFRTVLGQQGDGDSDPTHDSLADIRRDLAEIKRKLGI